MILKKKNWIIWIIGLKIDGSFRLLVWTINPISLKEKEEMWDFRVCGQTIVGQNDFEDHLAIIYYIRSASCKQAADDGSLVGYPKASYHK
jgi:hypothetical protein